MTTPYAHELQLAGASLARRRELLKALCELARRPMDIEALARVVQAQGPAVEAFVALSEALDRENELEDMFGPGWAQNSGVAAGDEVAPFEPGGPHRSDGGA